MRAAQQVMGLKLKIFKGFLAALMVWAAQCLWAEETRPPARIILFLGDSLTAGYGLDREDAYPAIIQGKLEKSGLPYRAVNGGVSGDTTAGGLRRIDWLLRQPVDILVLALGANDGLRGVTVESTRENLQAIINRAREENPEVKILLAGMQLPPNMGNEYTKSFRKIYPRLAQKNNIKLIPFLLEGVAAMPNLNQSDGIHPNIKGHQIVAKTVWTYLEDLLVEGDDNK